MNSTVVHSGPPADPLPDFQPLAVDGCEAVVLQVQQLVKSYGRGGRPAVDGLTFDVQEGEAFGLLGPNGAGKTTAISVMCTLLRPTAGSVHLDGIDVQAEPGRVRRLLGLVPQEIALYPRLTGRENLRYFARLYGLKGLELEERVADALELVQLQEHADRPVNSYSGGMKRRANLAAGMLHQPRILFLDEPTVGIDAQSRNLILDSLSRLRQAGTTLVYTTHYMEEAQQLCNRVAIMDGGRIIAEGEPAALIAGRAGCANLEQLFLQLTGSHLRDD
ncbi:MAG: ABC transporter ATP-binding protein [Desulfuromonadales bacterium]|nr:ABC transporter ATP-binding protein [Desulfuromonadales bacterium]